MKEATSKEKILKNIRQGLIYKTPDTFADLDIDSSVFAGSDEDFAIQFAHSFTQVAGKFVYCATVDECIQGLQSLLKDSQHIFCFENSIQQLLKNAEITYQDSDTHLKDALVGITTCEALLARTGSILISSQSSSGRRMSVFPPVHIVIAYTHQLFADINDALHHVKNKNEGKFPSLLSITTGPSRTSDIEKTLVLGAHGPKELFVFLIEG